MDLHLPASIALRPRRGMALPALALVVLMAAGCGHHRRSSMRPVFVAPAPSRVVVPDCPGGNCGPAASGSTTIEPGPLEGPAAAVPSSPTTSEPGLAPLDGPVGPTSTPPRPRAVPDAAEPSLDPPAATPSGRGTSLRTPSTSLNNKGRRGLLGRPRQASLRERLRPFVNDPEDLFTPPKADRPWKYVVLHHSAHATGSYDEIDREHRKVLGWEGCGYHFVVGNGTGSPDGQIEVAQRWSNQKHGVHCRDSKDSEVNEYGIGICLVGDMDHAAPTPRQIAATQALVAYLGDQYGISAERIDTHARLANSPTACPGKLFPAQAILGDRNYAQR